MSEDILRLTIDLYAFVKDSEHLTTAEEVELNPQRFRDWAEQLRTRFDSAKAKASRQLQGPMVSIRDNLKSMPASLGTRPAMMMSQALHCLCVALLFGVATTNPRMEWLFIGAVFAIALLLIYEHLTVKQWGTAKIALSFFTLNGIVSLVLGVAGIVDLLSSQ